MTTIDTHGSAPLRDRTALRAFQHVTLHSAAADGVAPQQPRIDPFLTVVKQRSVHDVNPDLWQWQAEALDEWHASDCRGVVEAVTGAGKTMLGLTAAFEAFRLGIKSLVLVPTAELQNQWLSRIHSTIPEAIVGTMGNGRHDSLTDCDIVVAIINSAARHKLLEDHQSGLLIADECHRYAAPTFVKALSERFDYRLGLTATYSRPDRANEDRLDPYFGGVIFRLWYDRALSDGVIAEFDVALVGIPLTPEERRDYDDFTSTMTKVGRGLRFRLNLHGSIGDLMQAAQRLAGRKNDQSPECIMARRYLDAVSRRLALLANAENKLHLLEGVSRVISHSAGTLVFAETIDTSTRAGEVLAAKGHTVEVISSASKPAERRGALQRFAVGHAKVLCAPRILDEGIDVPEADLAIVVSGTRQRRQSIQRLGRVIRRKKNGAKGRFVFVYAADTVEDPVVGKSSPLEDILPFAARAETFTHLHMRELIQFLLPPAATRAYAVDEGARDQTVSAALLPQTAAEPTVIPPVAEPQPVTDDAAVDIVLLIGEQTGDASDEPREQLNHVALSPDSVKQYLRDIGRTPLLTAEEEVALAKRIEAGLYAHHLWGKGQYLSRRERHDLEHAATDGKRAHDHFARANLRLVVNIAKKYVSGARKLEFLDLIQEGNLGLQRAIQKYDYTQGTKFSTYATWWIRQSITRAMADDDRTVRIPVHLVDQVKSHSRCEDNSSCDHNVALIERASAVQPRSLDQMLEADSMVGRFADSFRLVDAHTTHSDFVVPHPDEHVLNTELRRLVNMAIDATLEERDADIIRRRHGWFGKPALLERGCSPLSASLSV